MLGRTERELGFSGFETLVGPSASGHPGTGVCLTAIPYRNNK